VDVLAASISAELPKAHKKSTAGKLSGSPNSNKEQAAFADVLNSAAYPKRFKGETGHKADDRNNVTSSAPTGEVIPLFNNLVVMPVSIGDADDKGGRKVGTSTDTMFNQDVEVNLNQSNSKLSPFQVASQNGLISEGASKMLDGNTGNVNTPTTLANQSEQLQQTGISQVTTVPEDLNQNGLNSQTIAINQQENYGVKKQGTHNPDGKGKQATGIAVEQLISAGQSQLVSDNLLKPLATVSAYQNASVIAANNAADESLQADDPVQTLDMPVKESKVSLNAMTSLSADTSLETTNNGLFHEQNLSEATAVENVSDKPLQPFQQLLHQTGMKDQADAVVDIDGQPIPQTPKDTNNVVGQIVEHARLVKNSDMSEMIIKLKPEHLGELTLKVAVDNGVVSASFHTNNSEVRGIIEASMQQLRQDMAQQGLKVEYVGVYAGLGQPFSNGQGEANRQQAWKSQLNKKNSSNEFSESIEAIENTGITTSETGVDYRI